MVNLNFLDYFSAFPPPPPKPAQNSWIWLRSTADRHSLPLGYIQLHCIEIAKYMYTADSVVYFVEETQVLHVPSVRCSPVGRDV
jgi:hypothetical protein